jgi:hypothetical protein
MLNRYALLDKAGKTRLTCLATSGVHAGRRFRRMRGGKPVPEGWLIVWRGKAEAGHETAPRAAALSAKGVESLMTEARQLIHDQGEEILRLKGEAAVTEAHLAWVSERLDDARAQVKQLEACLEDARAIARVIELAKASPVEEWDHSTLLRDVLERGVEPQPAATNTSEAAKMRATA